MLTFNLKKQWYEKITSGEKRIEKVWTLEERFFSLTQPRNCLHIPCVFRLGYTRKYLNAVIDEIHIVDGKETDLRVDKPVYAMHFELEEE